MAVVPVIGFAVAAFLDLLFAGIDFARVSLDFFEFPRNLLFLEGGGSAICCCDSPCAGSFTSSIISTSFSLRFLGLRIVSTGLLVLDLLLLTDDPKLITSG